MRNNDLSIPYIIKEDKKCTAVSLKAKPLHLITVWINNNVELILKTMRQKPVSELSKSQTLYGKQGQQGLFQLFI